MAKSSLLKRMLVFVAAYLLMSTAIAYVFREDQDFISIGETIEYQGEEVSIKVLYKEGEDAWAQETLELVSGSIEKLMEAYSSNSPHSQISIYSSTLELTDGLPFDLERDSSSISVPVDYEINTAVWGIAQMWINKGLVVLPDWVIWGQSAFIAQWAMEESGFIGEAEAMRSYLENGISDYAGDMALDSYSLSSGLDDEGPEATFFLGMSFNMYEELYMLTSMDTIANVHKGVMSSQDYAWDSSRYVSYVQDQTDVDVSDIFLPVFGGDVSSEIFKWKIIHYLEIALTLIVSILIFVYTFWESVKERLSPLLFFRERTRAGRKLLRRYGSKDRILMELEVYFKRHIPDEDYDKYLNIFFKEKILSNKS